MLYGRTTGQVNQVKPGHGMEVLKDLSLAFA